MSCSTSSDDGSSKSTDSTTTISDYESEPTKWGAAIWSTDEWDDKSTRNHSQWGKSEWNTNQW